MKQLRRPQKSAVFQKLSNKKLMQLTPDDIDSVSKDAFIESGNQSMISDLSNVMNFSQSPGGPKSASSKIVSYTFTDTGRAEIFKADPGEVWLLQFMAMTFTSSSSYTYSINLNTDSEDMLVVGLTSKSGDGFLNVSKQHGFPDSSFYLDENTALEVIMGGSFTSVVVQLHLTRWR